MHLLILAALVVLSNFVESVAGFGGTLLVLSLGSQFVDVTELVPVLVPINVLLSTYLVARYHRAMDREELLRRVLPMTIFGAVLGILVARQMTGVGMKHVFGAVVLCLSVMELRRLLFKNGAKPRHKSAFDLVWVVGAGMMQGMYASGGPFLVHYLSGRVTDKLVFRTTLSTVWLILGSGMTAYFVVSGRMNAETLKASLMFLPALLLGLFLGEHLHKRIQDRPFRVFVYGMLCAAGFGLLLR